MQVCMNRTEALDEAVQAFAENLMQLQSRSHERNEKNYVVW